MGIHLKSLYVTVYNTFGKTVANLLLLKKKKPIRITTLMSQTLPVLTLAPPVAPLSPGPLDLQAWLPQQLLDIP